MTTRDTTLAGCAKRLRELGYAPTSATNPDRFIATNWSCRRESLGSLGAHPAALMLYPSVENGAEDDASDEDCKSRQIIDLVVTGYLMSLPRELKAIIAVLDSFKLIGGPAMTDGFGNVHRLLQWRGEPVFDNRYRARNCFPADDSTVLLQQAISPQYQAARTSIGSLQMSAIGPIGTHVLDIGGEWTGGHILDVPHNRLPELLPSDARWLIERVEEARWSGRPLAVAKEAAA
jgi:hypothetical protein